MAFVAGLLLAPVIYVLLDRAPDIDIDASYPLLVGAGLLVGIGTRYGAGCTSGHGVCGISRLSPRSIAATIVFIAVGMLTVFVRRHALG
ncbi:MAG TPA: YeeE/YedE thiosulfate transporter family protein, partial [Casimicrobiaceae bacterium]|nr:YeeE/YedE thiosulfate transporter family protein [Casimicrobiaceae bacterium]